MNDETHQDLLRRGYVVEEIATADVLANLPDCIRLTGAVARDRSFTSNHLSHPFFESPERRTLAPEEVASVLSDSPGQLPASSEEWELMLARAARSAARASRREAEAGGRRSPTGHVEYQEMEEVD